MYQAYSVEHPEEGQLTAKFFFGNFQNPYPAFENLANDFVANLESAEGIYRAHLLFHNRPWKIPNSIGRTREQKIMDTVGMTATRLLINDHVVAILLTSEITLSISDMMMQGRPNEVFSAFAHGEHMCREQQHLMQKFSTVFSEAYIGLIAVTHPASDAVFSSELNALQSRPQN